MKKNTLVLLLLFASCSFPQEINELIKPLNLSSGEEKIFLISDLFFADAEYKVKFKPDNSLKVFYEPETGEFKITSLKNSGYSVLPFIFYDSTYHILLKTEYKQSVNFSFKPDKPVEKLNLFGNFNGWNRENLPMHDTDDDGIYSTQVKLEPGRYEYKFFVEFTGSEKDFEITD
ncbi:MAG: hypothetical protein EHM47_10590, partial [Ignavibacteriales bacterium]